MAGLDRKVLNSRRIIAEEQDCRNLTVPLLGFFKR